MVPDRMKSADVIVWLLFIVFERQWKSGEASVHWKKANDTFFFKNDKKEDLGNYSLVNLISVYEMFIEQILLDAIFKHMKERKEQLTWIYQR